MLPKTLRVRLSPGAISAQCPDFPKTDMAGRFMSTRPRRASDNSRANVAADRRVTPRSGGIIFEGNSVSGLVYTSRGAINKKFYHATRRNPHDLLEQPRKYIPLLSRLHQICRLDSECLINHNKWTHLFFILMKCSLISTGRRSQFAGQHIGPDERETRALTR